MLPYILIIFCISCQNYFVNNKELTKKYVGKQSMKYLKNKNYKEKGKFKSFLETKIFYYHESIYKLLYQLLIMIGKPSLSILNASLLFLIVRFFFFLHILTRKII